eukprot:SAG31_NODE_1494_length_8106_cov_7.933183_1_plen_671_part_00
MRMAPVVILALLAIAARPAATSSCVHAQSTRACHVPGTPYNKSSCCGETAPPHECFGGCCLGCNGPVMDPRSRCVFRNSSVSHCPPPAAPPPPPRPARPCKQEMLASGIQLPCPWPPKRNMTRASPVPFYISSPPAVISIDQGRQLFVDDFLVSHTQGVRREYARAIYRDDVNPVMSATKPWEKRNMTYARAYSGGVWWIPSDDTFKMWYGCGTSPKTDSCIGLCLATSADGINWKKPDLDVVAGTNIVINEVLKSNNVWFDLDDANASRRYKMADSGGTDPERGFGWSYRLWSSADGIHWHQETDRTGPTSDRSTVFPNALRKPRRWTFSIKNYRTDSERVFGRSRLYWDTPSDDFYSASWGDAEPVPWQAAETLDPGYVEGPDVGQPAQLYNLDAYGYESIIVGYFSLFRCKANMKGCPTHPEFDSIYIGFSRDGYSWTKPPPGQPLPFRGVDLTPTKRGPFMSMASQQQVGKYPDAASERWNYGAVQSVSGGVVLPNDKAQVSTMLTYAGGQSGYSTMGISPGCTVGVASLRRDGFAAMAARDSDVDGGSTITTRPLSWSAEKKFLFLNLDGEVTIGLLRASNGADMLRSVALRANDTRVVVQWEAKSTLPHATTASPVQLRFQLSPGTKIFSFWVSASTCGASGGLVAGGGRGYNSSRDEHGACAR